MSIGRKNERGQAMVILLAPVTLFVIMGLAVLVIDLGNWFHTQRRLQGTADAAALAGAQRLPTDPAGAKTQALTYANKNGGDVAGADITVTSTVLPNDTIRVGAEKNDPGFFSKVFNIAGADVKTHAKVRVGPPAQARYVAPMTVYCGHDLIKNCNKDHVPTFNVETTMAFDKMGAPGAFGMLNLENGNGTPGASDEANWIRYGFDKYLPTGTYRSDPGGKFESSALGQALDARVGSVLLFPVFKTLEDTGQNAEYEIIGWIGFHLTSWKAHGHSAELTGYFTEFIAQGILASSGGSGSGPSSTWGVKSIQLIE